MRDEQFQEALKEATREISKLSELAGYYNNYVAVQVPSICIEYLLQYSGFPLGCFVCIIGRKASFKSHLSVEIARWLLPYNGYVVLLDTEGGVNPLCRVILGDDNLSLETCVYLEDWQTKLTKYSSAFVKMYKEKNMNIPIAFIVDSIVGAESRNIGAKIDEEGSIGSVYPIEAKLISSYLKHKNTILSQYPFLLIGINHIRDVINPTAGRAEEYIPGGAALLYHAQLVLKVRKSKKPEYKGNMFETTAVITVEKNRLGPEDLSIEVPFCFNQVRTDTGFIMRPEWKWHQASVDLLAEGVGVTLRARDKFLKRVSEVLVIGKKNAGRYGLRYYCEQLGISESDAVSADELMTALYANQKVLDELRCVLMIKPAVFFKHDVPYSKLLHSKPEDGRL